MRQSNLRAAVGIGVAFSLVSILSFGCGNPEAPQITNVRLSYWDSLSSEEGEWVRFDDGGVAPQSPVRVQGNITDNTAVVSPRIVWIGERGDVDPQGFAECTEEKNEFYECEMTCEETQPGFFECNPLLPSEKLIRGDLFQLTLSTTAGEKYELDVQVSEAQDLLVPDSEGDPIQILEDYRILRVTSQTDAPNPFLWTLFQRKTAEGPWLPLRAGDVLAMRAGDDAFQIAIGVPEGVELDEPPSAVWRSLAKWNEDSFLNWDARTGNFEEEFQFFDPRDRQEITGDEGASVFRFAVSAEDVPDQKTGVFRFSEVLREFVFSPEMATQEPALEVDGEEEELIEASSSAENVVGTVESFSGEVRSLGFSLSQGPEAPPDRFFYFNPNQISLAGGFAATIVYIGDWDGDGIVDEPGEDGGIPNTVTVVALDMQGNWKRTTLPVVFPPSTAANQPPELQVLEIFPTLDGDGLAQLPFDEELRVRARAADDRGQPELSGLECHCADDEPLINLDRCPCMFVGTGELNAGGEFPRNPWEWLVIDPEEPEEPEEPEDPEDPEDPPESKTIGVLLAREKVEDPEDLSTARFTGIEIALLPNTDEKVFQVAVSAPETVGPNVVLSGFKNGDIVDPNDLFLQATIFPNVSEINQIKALWNGESRGTPIFKDSTSFEWDLRGETVREGDRICVGAVSVTGHAVLNLLEFVSVTDGLLLGLTVTTDTRACDPLP